jgi:hypothetical protein
MNHIFALRRILSTNPCAAAGLSCDLSLCLNRAESSESDSAFSDSIWIRFATKRQD